MATFSDKDADPLADEAALAAHIEAALAAGPLQGLEMDLAYGIVKRLFKPTVLGADNIPDRPCRSSATIPCLPWTGWYWHPSCSATTDASCGPWATNSCSPTLL